MGDITVYAPRGMEERSPTTGAPIQLVTISRVVNIRDLDLRTAAGSAELNRRISSAARSACQRLDTLYPVGAPDLPACVRTAVERAQADVAQLTR